MRIKVTERILVIGDAHIPAEHPDYLAFCKAVKNKYRTTTILSAGDLVDWHAISYHESDPDLPSPGEEWELVRDRLKSWSRAFPKLTISMGNHGKLPQRKISAELRHH